MDWGSIKRNLRVQSGRSRRVNQQIAEDRTKRRQAQISATNTNPGAEDLGKVYTDRKMANMQKSRMQQKSPSAPNTSTSALRGKEPPSTQANKDHPQAKQAGAGSLHKKQLHETDEDDDFDLRPPVRLKQPTSVGHVSKLLFSAGHLDTIIHDASLFAHFTNFLHRYRPQLAAALTKYLETQKAINAVEYANAVAESVADLSLPDSGVECTPAAYVNTSFNDMSKDAFDKLLSEALPAFITFGLIKITTEIMVHEITGQSTAIMDDLVTGLSEVFCLVDPKQEDNPIIYASEEFYTFTGYSRDSVIGSNCRFLQGPETERHSVRRLRQATKSGQELSETLLNYRRDGTPFMNILMIAPLHDNKGRVKYYIGAQVDATALVADGKGLPSFKRYLLNEQSGSRRPPTTPSTSTDGRSHMAKQRALKRLGALSELFDIEEAGVVAQSSRSDTLGHRSEDVESTSGRSKQRRVFNEPSEDESEPITKPEKGDSTWSLTQSGLSGKLPGVYENYFLMRPDPSFKIIFISPGLKRMSRLVQSSLFSHITAPRVTLNGLKESFASGNSVTAKVTFSASASGPDNERQAIQRQSRGRLEESRDEKAGRSTWLSATPLLGADDRVGVWMVVVVDSAPLGEARRPQKGRKSQDIASNVSENNAQSGSSTPKDADSKPDTSRAILSTTSSPVTQRPTHIEIPEGVYASRRKDVDMALASDKIQEYYVSADPRSPRVEANDIPVGGSAATPNPSLHLTIDFAPDGELNSSQTDEQYRNDSPVDIISSPKSKHRKRQSLPQSHSDFAPGKSAIQIDYLRHLGAAGLMTSSMAPSQINEGDGSLVTQLVNGGDEAGGEGRIIRTPFSVD